MVRAAPLLLLLPLASTGRAGPVEATARATIVSAFRADPDLARVPPGRLRPALIVPKPKVRPCDVRGKEACRMLVYDLP